MSGRNLSRRNFGVKGGQGFKKNNNGGRQNSATNKTMEGFTFYVGSAKQASDYENTALFVINHTKKDFDRGNDIAEDLQNLEYGNTDDWKFNFEIKNIV